SYSSPDRPANEMRSPIKLVPVEKSSLSLDLDGMANAAKGAGLVFVCNTNNPTATVHSVSAIADFVKKVRATSPGTAIHVDEAYLDYASDPNGTAAPLALEYPTSSSRGRSRRPTAWRDSGLGTRSGSRPR